MSILDDIDITLETGNNEIIATVGNEPGSLLREFFNIHERVETPFSATADLFEVNNDDTFRQTAMYMTSENPSFADVAGTCVDTIKVNGSLYIYGGVGTKMTAENTANKIICSKLEGSFTEIDGVDIECISNRHSGFPGISVTHKTFYNKLRLANMNISLVHNMNYDSIGFRIRTSHMPVFENVTSSDITSIFLTDNICEDSLIKNNIDWSKILEFGYTIVGEGVRPKTIKIDSFEAIYKLASKSTSASKCYSSFPYKLKDGAKLSDLIDISGFENFEILSMHDRKVGVIFAKNTSNKLHASTYYEDSLKSTVDKDEFIDSLPTTADGYKMIIYNL